MGHALNNIVAEIQKQERKLSAETSSFIDEAYKMTVYLQELLSTVKDDVIKDGFSSKDEEIHFFKQVKPNILGKLIYYNKKFNDPEEIITAVKALSENKKYFSVGISRIATEYFHGNTGEHY